MTDFVQGEWWHRAPAFAGALFFSVSKAARRFALRGVSQVAGLHFPVLTVAAL